MVQYKSVPSRSSTNEDLAFGRQASRAKLISTESSGNPPEDDLASALDIDLALLDDSKSRGCAGLRPVLLRVLPYLLLVLTVVIIIIVFQGSQDFKQLSGKLFMSESDQNSDSLNQANTQSDESGARNAIQGESRFSLSEDFSDLPPSSTNGSSPNSTQPSPTSSPPSTTDQPSSPLNSDQSNSPSSTPDQSPSTATTDKSPSPSTTDQPSSPSDNPSQLSPNGDQVSPSSSSSPAQSSPSTSSSPDNEYTGPESETDESLEDSYLTLTPTPESTPIPGPESTQTPTSTPYKVSLRTPDAETGSQNPTPTQESVQATPGIYYEEGDWYLEEPSVFQTPMAENQVTSSGSNPSTTPSSVSTPVSTPTSPTQDQTSSGTLSPTPTPTSTAIPNAEFGTPIPTYGGSSSTPTPTPTLTPIPQATPLITPKPTVTPMSSVVSQSATIATPTAPPVSTGAFEPSPSPPPSPVPVYITPDSSTPIPQPPVYSTYSPSSPGTDVECPFSPAVDAYFSGGEEAALASLQDIVNDSTDPQSALQQNCASYMADTTLPGAATILHFAVVEGLSDVVEFLVSDVVGLDPDILDVNGFTATQQLLRDLLVGEEEGSPSLNQNQTGNDTVVQILGLLIDAGADPLKTFTQVVDGLDVENFTIVHAAAAAARYDVIQLLGDQGLDLNLLDYQGNNPIHTAALFCGNDDQNTRLTIIELSLLNIDVVGLNYLDQKPLEVLPADVCPLTQAYLQDQENQNTVSGLENGGVDSNLADSPTETPDTNLDLGAAAPDSSPDTNLGPTETTPESNQVIEVPDSTPDSNLNSNLPNSDSTPDTNLNADLPESTPNSNLDANQIQVPNSTPDSTPDSNVDVNQVQVPDSTPDSNLDANLPESTPDSNLNANLVDSTPDSNLDTSLPDSTPDSNLDASLPDSTPDSNLDSNLVESTPDSNLDSNLVESTPDSNLDADLPNSTPDTDAVTLPQSTPEEVDVLGGGLLLDKTERFQADNIEPDQDQIGNQELSQGEAVQNLRNNVLGVMGTQEKIQGEESGRFVNAQKQKFQWLTGQMENELQFP